MELEAKVENHEIQTLNNSKMAETFMKRELRNFITEEERTAKGKPQQQWQGRQHAAAEQ